MRRNRWEEGLAGCALLPPIALFVYAIAVGMTPVKPITACFGLASILMGIGFSRLIFRNRYA